MMSSTLFLLFLSYLLRRANGDGMIEVLKWKQMDFYNRGDRDDSSNIGVGGIRQSPTRSPDPSVAVVFPDRYAPDLYGRGMRTYRANNAFTSRDTPVGYILRAGGIDDMNSSYIAYNNVPMGATHYRGRLFITMPRRRVGIPSTLNYVDLRRDRSETSPKLHAYPSFELNQFERNAQNLVSVYRTTVDACQRLWFIDTGMLEYPDNRQQIRRPSIWIIDLKTDRMLKRFDIPESIAETGRGLASLSIDVSPQQCGQAYAYIPDLVYRRLYVFSLAADRMWAFSHNYFNFDPVAGDLNIGGQTFRWDDGIFSATIGPLQDEGNRDVYFHAMASNNEFVVSNRVLQEQSNAARSDHGNDFRLLGSRGLNKQSTMHHYDSRTGVIFYDEIQNNGIGCWNTKEPFSVANHGTVVSDERMIYPSDLTIDEDGNIWVMSNSMPIFIYDTLDTNVYNFRIWRQNVHEAKRNTVCE